MGHLVAYVVIGFDPGSEWTGYGVIDVAGTAAQPTFTFVDAGEIESTGPAVDAFFTRCDPFNLSAGRTVGVELTQGVVYGKKGAGIVPHLISTGRADSMICENARWRGLDLVMLPAVRWREAVCANAHADDPLVKVWIHRLVRKLPKQSNKHKRDALGVAVAIGMGMRK